MPTVFKLRRGTAQDWAVRNPRLMEGEIGYELGTNKYKIGDGVSRWNDLEYFIDRGATQAMVDAAFATEGGTALTNHVNSETPHPVYDDGPSLTLLYENAKV